MFDIGWTEMLVIAVVMIVIVGPKELPKMLRTFGKTTAKLRTMAGDFQRQFNEAMREAELDDVKKSVDDLRSLNPANEIRKHLNPLSQAATDIRSTIQSSLNAQPDTSSAPASDVAQPAEPLKVGPADMPGEAVSADAPVTPVQPGSDPAVTAAPAAAPTAQGIPAGSAAPMTPVAAVSLPASAPAEPGPKAKPVPARKRAASSRAKVVPAAAPLAAAEEPAPARKPRAPRKKIGDTA